jgi:surface protein
LNEINVPYLDTLNVNALDEVFKELPEKGTISYSSDKLTSNVVEMIPEGWTKKDLMDSLPEDSKIYLIAKYDVTSTSQKTKIYSRFAAPPFPKDFTPYISSVWVNDKKVNATGGEVQFTTEGKTTVKIYFKKELEFLDGFFMFTPLVEVDFSNFDVSKVTSMSSLFKTCYKLEEINYGDNFKAKGLTSMSEFFSGCLALVQVDLSKFDTSNVRTMDSMFDGCENLKKITFGNNFNTAKVTRMRRMFGNCKSLKSVDLSKFDTSSVEVFESMFEDCSSLESVDTKYIKTDSAYDISGMFEGCSSLTSVDISSFNTEKLIDISYLFSQCTGLESVNFGIIDTKQIFAMEYMLANCTLLTEVDLSNFDTPQLSTVQNLFFGSTSLKEIDISNLDCSNVETYDDIFTDLPAQGTIKYNSEKCSKIVGMLPQNWEKKDVA